MSAQDNGGPAFPNLSRWDEGAMRYSHEGMELRDYFAAKAMQGVFQMIATGVHTVARSDIEGGIAKDAYRMADSMLKARQA
jgi:hypothetical protein